MIIIPYKYEKPGSYFILTPCPFKCDVRVGSANCSDCDGFIAKNQTTQVVVCRHELRCSICNRLHTTLDGVTDCRKKCSCKHDWEYKVESLSGEELELERRCSICGKFEEEYFTSSDFTQEMMNGIWTENIF